MSAFNDFCIVCDQLILGENLPRRVDKLLYCSEDCMVKDTSNVPPTAASAESSESASAGSLDDVDSLIASPLLIPMDETVTISHNGDEEDEYMLMKVELASQAVPRVPTVAIEAPNSGDHGIVQTLDRVAENNYKLWLSQNL